jgi:tRNA(Ile)-lysidine synthase
VPAPRSPSADAPGPLSPGRSRPQLLDAVRDALRTVPDGAVVVVALSGGPDSTALAYLTAEARPDLQVTLAHVRHGLRDDQHDLEVVTQHAAWLGLPLVVRQVTVPDHRAGPAAAARAVRYAALREVLTEVGGSWLLVGHHADDQAETVLLRAARGTGLAGLAGMPEAQGDLVRPLLRIRAGDLRRFVELEGLPVATDPSNRDPAARRSIVRHEVLPVLGRVGPDPVGALGRLAELARADDEALRAWADEVLRGARHRIGPVLAVRDDVLAAVPAAVAARVVRRLVAEVMDTIATPSPSYAPTAPTAPPASSAPSAATVARVLGLAAGRQLDLLGGVQVTAGGGWRAFAPALRGSPTPVTLAAPGASSWPAADVRVVAVTAASEREGADGPAADGQIAFSLPDAWTPPRVRPDRRALPPGGRAERLAIVLPADLGALRIRARAEGDRVRTTVGTQRLQDVFVDAGVPRPVRDRWPVVVAADRVVWVPGLVADAEALRAGRAAPALLLVCEREGRRRSR